jgi:hypothetical protein
MVGCHNDGNPLNNKLDNLRWDTFLNNSLDMIKHGTIGGFESGCNYGNNQLINGDKISWSKLDDDKVRLIRSLAPYRGCYARLAKQFNVTRTTISDALHRRSWTHI